MSDCSDEDCCRYAHQDKFNYVLKELVFRTLNTGILYEITFGKQYNIFFLMNVYCNKCDKYQENYNDNCKYHEKIAEFWSVEPIFGKSYQIIEFYDDDVIEDFMDITPYHSYFDDDHKYVDEMYKEWMDDIDEYNYILNDSKDKIETKYIKIIQREESINCDICYKQNNETGKCLICKKEICIDCRLQIDKCPFCRTIY
jgi:hypothetical protein